MKNITPNGCYNKNPKGHYFVTTPGWFRIFTSNGCYFSTECGVYFFYISLMFFQHLTEYIFNYCYRTLLHNTFPGHYCIQLTDVINKRPTDVKNNVRRTLFIIRETRREMQYAQYHPGRACGHCDVFSTRGQFTSAIVNEDIGQVHRLRLIV